MTRLGALVLLLGVASRVQAGEGPSSDCQSPAQLESLVEAYKSSGNRYVEPGSRLSACLLADDDRFFRRMLAEPQVYDAWLKGLGWHTFTVWKVSQKERTDGQKARMSEIAERRSADAGYGSLARSLAEQLSKTDIEVLSPALVVVDGAREISPPKPVETKPPPAGVRRDFPGAIVFGGDGSVSGLSEQKRQYVGYVVQTPYPATDFLAELSRQLREAGYEPLRMDWNNPTRPSSLSRGWSYHSNNRDPTTREPMGQFHWAAQWRNAAGDLVSYYLNYHTPIPAAGAPLDKPGNEDLKVSASVAFQKIVPVDSLPAALVVADGARDANAWRDDDAKWDRLGMNYSIRADFPAADFVSLLTERLAKQGWTPLPAEESKVWKPTAEGPDWRAGLDNFGTPTREIFRWQREWRSGAGDEVEYTLTYESALPAPEARAVKPDNSDLYVKAALRQKSPSKDAALKAERRRAGGRVYTAPSGNFRVRYQGSIGQVSAQDGSPRPGDWAVSFRDETCREFLLEERSRGLRGGTLDEWIDRNLAPELSKAKFQLKERKPVSTPLGPGISLRALQPQGSPCSRSIRENGKERKERIDLDAGIWVLPAENRVYVFRYGTDADDSAMRRLTGPPEEVLERFVEDFEVLKPASAARSPSP